MEASLDTPTADSISSLQAGSPQTPQSSKWSIGNLFQSTRSIEVSPLASVFESPELFLQTPTKNTAQTSTGEVPPTKPKNRRWSLTSAKDARAKHRRHNNSVIKPVKPTTAGKNQRDRLSLAREGSSTSSRTETTDVEEEQFSDIKSTDRVQGEARQVEAEGPTAKPTIRWPSRSLDRMNQNKRKRWGEPVAVPSPDSERYGLAKTNLYENSEEDGMTEQPGKIRRTTESREFTSQVAEDRNTARPYEYQGTNIFTEYRAAQKAANTREQFLSKTPIPITNPTGTFKVPSPGDSDWSDSGSEEEEGSSMGLEDMTTSRNSNGEFALANPRFLQLKLPKPQRIPPLTQSEALRKAREGLLKHKPRNPSKLIQSSSAYSSPASLSEAAVTGPQGAAKLEPSTTVNLEQTSRTIFTAFKDWCKTAPPAVAAALESMEVDSNVAGNEFARGLENNGTGLTNRYTAFEEWSKTAPPTVTAVLENMEVDSNYAGQAFKSGLDNCIEF